MVLFVFPTISTDAPIYHLPFTTVGLIVANVVCFAVAGFGDPEATQPWVLEFGHINPIEWVTNNFAHINFGHLAGNMVFLWVFGVVVEGKVGWYRMLALYMAIGISQAAFIQIIMLPWNFGGALGASSAITGLMAITMIWAPRNEHGIVYFFWFLTIIRAGVVGVTYMWIVCVYLAMQFLSWIVFYGGALSTPALHLTGAMFGTLAGILMLKKGWVDCENWDLFRVMSGNYGLYADPTTTVGSHADPTLMFGKADVKVKDDLPDNSQRAQNSRLIDRINKLIDAGDVITASEQMFDLRLKDSESRLTEKRLKKLGMGLLKANMPDDAEIYVEEYIERFQEDCAWARVRMAQLQLSHLRRPNAALQTLKRVRLSQLSQDMTDLAKKIAAAAKKQVKAGVQDAEPEW